MSDIKSYVRESRGQEVNTLLDNSIKELQKDGLIVEFGKIGNRTTYAFIHDESYNVEIVGYTFLKDLKFYKENLGKLKALQQAMARKRIAEEEVSK